MTWTAKTAGIFKVGNFRKSWKMLSYFFFSSLQPESWHKYQQQKVNRPANSSHPQNVIFVFIQVKEKEREDSKGDKPLLKEVIIITNKLITGGHAWKKNLPNKKRNTPPVLLLLCTQQQILQLNCMEKFSRSSRLNISFSRQIWGNLKEILGITKPKYFIISFKCKILLSCFTMLKKKKKGTCKKFAC